MTTQPIHFVADKDFDRKDAIKAISAKLQGGDLVEMQLGEYWIALLWVCTPDIPDKGEMEKPKQVSVQLGVAVPTRCRDADYPDPRAFNFGIKIVLSNARLDFFRRYHVRTRAVGFENAVVIAQGSFDSPKLSLAIGDALDECGSIYSMISAKCEEKERAEVARQESISSALAEHARLMRM